MPDRLTRLRNMLDSDPNDPFCMYGIAMEYARAGRSEKAIAWFDRTIDLDPAYCYAWYHKARCQADAGALGDACSTLEEGIGQAEACGDGHAAEEMQSLLSELATP